MSYEFAIVIEKAIKKQKVICLIYF